MDEAIERLDHAPFKFKAVLTDAEGVEHDIEYAVAVLYDLVVNSMDWGSGFLSDEEVFEVLDIGDLCGFDTAGIRTSIEREKEREREARERRAEVQAEYAANVERMLNEQLDRREEAGLTRYTTEAVYVPTGEVLGPKQES